MKNQCAHFKSDLYSEIDRLTNKTLFYKKALVAVFLISITAIYLLIHWALTSIVVS